MITNFRALVVDDEIGICRSIARYLTSKGIESVYALDGIEALNLFDRQRFDIVISDLRMPNMHGFTLVKELFKRHPQQLIAVMTGVEEAKLAYELLAIGVRMVIPKPFSFEYLTFSLMGILEHQYSNRSARARKLLEPDSTTDTEGKSIPDLLTEEIKNIQEQFHTTIRELEEQYVSLERDYLDSVKMLAELMDKVRQGTSSHVSRVEDLARRIGEKVGLTLIEARHLSLAAFIHDLGKFSMPEYIIQKRPSAMNDEELAQYKHHPGIGGIVVASIPGLGPVGAMIEDHHENFNGSGFPMGKKADDLPISHQILRLADGLDRYFESLNINAEPDWAPGEDYLKKNADRFFAKTLVEPALNAINDVILERKEMVMMDLNPSQLRPGMRLAQDILHSKDVYLLRCGVVLTARMLDRLTYEYDLPNRMLWVRVYLPKTLVGEYA
ncbi:MAG: HD domain-containing phosphohydrolase [Calditrichota bacterium]